MTEMLELTRNVARKTAKQSRCIIVNIAAELANKGVFKNSVTLFMKY